MRVALGFTVAIGDTEEETLGSLATPDRST